MKFLVLALALVLSGCEYVNVNSDEVTIKIEACPDVSVALEDRPAG